MASQAPAGVRAAGWDSGLCSSRLRWVDPGPLSLAISDHVVVQEDGTTWIGEVLVAPERLKEWVEQPRLPVVVGRAPADERPTVLRRAGARLLDGLPPGLLGER